MLHPRRRVTPSLLGCGGQALSVDRRTRCVVQPSLSDERATPGYKCHVPRSLLPLLLIAQIHAIGCEVISDGLLVSRVAEVGLLPYAVWS